jgi:predicted unusual protein kinase regulating ubiquinone biosynthesis (AarF/ABC1/UbiB family)
VQVTLHELDYAREADSAERVRHNLRNDKRIRVPRVIRAYCRSRVLCLEDITGLRVDDRALILEKGGSAREVLRAIIGAYCQQIYVDGFFQSDPHPGNSFFIRRAPIRRTRSRLSGSSILARPKEMPPEFHATLRRAVTAVVRKDPDAFLAALVEMGVVEEAEIGKVRHVVLKLGEQIKDGTLTELMHLDYESLARDVIKALRELEAFSVPNDLILYGRTLGLLQGLTYLLDPDSADLRGRRALPNAIRVRALAIERRTRSAPCCASAKACCTSLKRAIAGLSSRQRRQHVDNGAQLFAMKL